MNTQMVISKRKPRINTRMLSAISCILAYQADTITEMIRTLPEEKRALVVKFVADVVNVLK